VLCLGRAVSDIPSAWYDKEDGTVVVCFDRVSLTLALEEFLDFYDLISETKDMLLAEDDVCIGTYEEDGKIKRQLIVMPDPEDIN
jgi:hypothetical protein